MVGVGQQSAAAATPSMPQHCYSAHRPLPGAELGEVWSWPNLLARLERRPCRARALHRRCCPARDQHPIRELPASPEYPYVFRKAILRVLFFILRVLFSFFGFLLHSSGSRSHLLTETRYLLAANRPTFRTQNRKCGVPFLGTYASDYFTTSP